MFPEGMRSTSGHMIPALPGSALIAVDNDVPVLPVGITGTEKMWQLSWIFKRPCILVTIGKPFTLSHNGRVTKEQLAGLTDTIMSHIAELLPSEYHGVYAKKV
jgi:1-acyl-sn-glycerol-3-phosphate acyltransferase